MGLNERSVKRSTEGKEGEKGEQFPVSTVKENEGAAWYVYMSPQSFSLIDQAYVFVNLCACAPVCVSALKRSHRISKWSYYVYYAVSVKQ